MQKSNIELDAFSIDIVEKQVIEDLLDALTSRQETFIPVRFRQEWKKTIMWIGT